MDAEAVKLLGAGLAMGLGAIGPGIGLGILFMGALQAIGRNPEGPYSNQHVHRHGLYRSRGDLRAGSSPYPSICGVMADQCCGSGVTAIF
jgi:hypothetical protein